MIHTAQVIGQIAGDSCSRVPIEFVYDTDDPYAVRAVFSGTTVWHFALELLADGLRWPVGEGDVRLWPGPGVATLLMLLRTPSAEALIALPFGEMTRFVDQAEQLAAQVPEISWDRELARLLDGA